MPAPQSQSRRTPQLAGTLASVPSMVRGREAAASMADQG